MVCHDSVCVCVRILMFVFVLKSNYVCVAHPADSMGGLQATQDVAVTGIIHTRKHALTL
jgi:hypothetical protein